MDHVNRIPGHVAANVKPVFLDQTGRRWKLSMASLAAFALLTLVGACLFAAGMFHPPVFPRIKVDDARVREQNESRDQEGLKGTLVKTAFAKDNANLAAPVRKPRAVKPRESTRPPIVFGFHVPWDENSFPALKSNAQHLTCVLAEWLILQTASGDLDDRTEIPVVEWSRQAKLPVLAVVTNYRDNRWQEKEVHEVLSHPATRHRLVRNIHSIVREYGLAGVNIDFEQVPVADRNQLTAFVRELHKVLKPDHSMITQDVPTDDPHEAAYDMRALAELNDYVIPMVYDEHFAAGDPGPVASLSWARNQMEEVLDVLPPDKTVIGLGNYGYDWTLGSTRAAVEVGFSDVISRANQYLGAIQWDSGLKNPSLEYTQAGVQHEVWFLDAVTALNSVLEAHRKGFAGVAFWRLGAADPALWTLFGDKSWPREDFRSDSLAPLSAIEGVRQYGRGEAIVVTQTKSNGWRRVWRDQGDFQEQFERVPTGDVVAGISSPESKSVTLTFDDGPDPRYTPRILDILHAKKVTAAFFVVGRPAADSPELLRRMYREGHDIGSHTYSHRSNVTTSEADLALELNWTQRIIESAIDRSTTLYRSPYKADSDLRTPEAIRGALWPQRLGYTFIGERIDPRDWEAKSPGEILDIVIRDKELGNIILLHDGGENREVTIQALPEVIDRLRSDGYRFVSLHELLGRSRDELMPRVSLAEWTWAEIEGGPFILRGRVLTFIRWLFLAAIALTLLRTLVYGALSLMQKIRSSKQVFEPGFRPPVSVIIAARNERKVITRTVASVIDSDYADYEVIVVDDGSSDGTAEAVRREFRGNRLVRVLSQPNLGKAAALNRAIAEASHEILVTLDADTLLCPSTIGNLVRHFADPKVAAVSGNLKAGNTQKWIACLQSIEYVCGFNLDRRALDLLNAVAVVPGAAGAWRKSAVLEAGGHALDTVAEDTDLTLAIRRRGHLIRYDEDAIAYTEVPETLTGLARQRLRWTFGTLQSAWKHRDTTFRARYGSMGFVTMPVIWLHQIMFGAISPIAEIALVVACLSGNLKVALTYYAAFFLLELMAGVFAYALEGENPRPLSLLLFQRILYPRLMLYVVSKSLLFAIGGRAMPWGVRVRRASVGVELRGERTPVLEKAG
jgi:peptidoglycan-N-acetylglucosamine deacetylase